MKKMDEKMIKMKAQTWGVHVYNPSKRTLMAHDSDKLGCNQN